MRRVAAWALWCGVMGCATTPSAAPEPSAERYAPIPASILTPDTVQTRIGTLRFFDGLPDEATVKTVYDHLDFARAVQLYVRTLPGVSMVAMRKGMDAAGMLPNYTVLLTESLMDGKARFLQGDTETVYAMVWISLKGGPIVVETPPRALGLFVDAWQRPLAETGKNGPDRGRGGRYVLVPPAYAGYVPPSKFAVTSPTYGVWAVFRGSLSKGSPKRAVSSFKKDLKVYPLKESARPPPNMFVDISGRAFDTVAPTNATFFDALAELVREEPNESQDPEVLGLLDSIGIRNGERFTPDDRMKAILDEAATVGDVTARALLFAPRDSDARLYDDRQWQRILVGGTETFVRGGARQTDARARFHLYATGATQAMAVPEPGARSVSAAVFRDASGEPLDGARTYTLTLPPNVPAAYFWSLTLYDNEARSMLQTDQRFPSILSGQKGLRPNDDGSITLRFGPKEPRSRRARANWIQTVPGEGWNAVLRIYGPKDAWFDRSWRPGDIEVVEGAEPGRPRSKPPSMRTKRPPSLRTPSRTETRIGPLELVHGIPTDATAERVYEHLDFIRGVETFLSMIPGASLVAMRRGLREVGVDGNGTVAIVDRMDAHSLFLTPNTESVYALTWLDLHDGALIVESPPNTLGVVDDFFFRYVADLGNAGPDEGKGGAFLFVPPEYQGQISERYFNFVSRTYGNVLLWRGFPVDGDPAPAVAAIERAVRIEPLDIEIPDGEIVFTEEDLAAGNEDAELAEPTPDPSAARFVRLTGASMNTIHSNDVGFYTEIDELVQEERPEALGPELLGRLGSIGIAPGKPFAPDERMKSILIEAAAVGNATARAIAFRHRDPSARIYEGSAWFGATVGQSHRFERRGVRLVDARTMFFTLATMTTPAMVTTKVGVGSQYALVATDRDGAYLDGGRHYRLTLPANVPAKDFWSVVVYDPQTRSMLQTPQTTRPSLNDQNDSPVPNPDGSTTIYFGPTEPPGRAANWIPTVPGKGWFAILRLYGPLQPWYNQSWRPGEIEPLRWKRGSGP